MMTSGQYSFPPVNSSQVDATKVSTDTYRSPFAPDGHVHFVWSDHASPLPQILKDHSLPLVVKVTAVSSCPSLIDMKSSVS